MKVFLFLISFLISSNLFSQNIEYKIYFLNDSIRIGDSISLISALKYPENIEIVQPDSSYNFTSFEFIGKKIFPSFSNGNIIYDSTIYYLRTFEIDSIQRLNLNATIINNKDSLVIPSNTDSIALIYQVSDVNFSKTKENTLFNSIRSIFNSEKVLIIIGFIILIIIIIYLLFRKKIKKYLKIRKLRIQIKIFNNDFDYILKDYLNNQEKNDLERLLLLWKRFMEKLSKRPYSTSTTTEISSFLENKKLLNLLKDIDRNLYSNNKDGIKLSSINLLKKEANNLLDNNIKIIERGK